MAKSTLAHHLKELEKDRFLTNKPDGMKGYIYSLTKKGKKVVEEEFPMGRRVKRVKVVARESYHDAEKEAEASET